MRTRSNDAYTINLHELYQLEYALSSKVKKLLPFNVRILQENALNLYGMDKFSLATHRLHILHAALISAI